MAAPLFLVFSAAALACLAGAVVKLTNPLHGLYFSTELVSTLA